MSRKPFLSFLGEAQVALFDGALGTEIYNQGFFLNQCYDVLCLAASDSVLDVHRAYI